MLHSHSMPALSSLDVPVANGHAPAEPRPSLTRSMPMDHAAPPNVKLARESDSIPFADNHGDSAASFFQTLSVSAQPPRPQHSYAEPVAPAPSAYPGALGASAPPQFGRPAGPPDAADFFDTLAQSAMPSAHYQPAPSQQPPPSRAPTLPSVPVHASVPQQQQQQQQHVAPTHYPTPVGASGSYDRVPDPSRQQHAQARQPLHHSQPVYPTYAPPGGAPAPHPYAPYPSAPDAAYGAAYAQHVPSVAAPQPYGAPLQPYGSGAPQQVPRIPSHDPFPQHAAASYAPQAAAPTAHAAASGHVYPTAPSPGPTGPYADQSAPQYAHGATQYGSPAAVAQPTVGSYAAPFSFDQRPGTSPAQAPSQGRQWASASFPSPYGTSPGQTHDQASGFGYAPAPDRRGSYGQTPAWGGQPQQPYTPPPSGLSQSLPAQPHYGSASWGQAAQAHGASRGSELERRPHCIGVFGLNGRLVTMFPRRRLKLNTVGSAPVPDESGELRPGLVRISTLDRVLADTDYLRQFLAFPGPLCTSGCQDKATKFVADRAAAYRAGGDPRSLGMANLYDLLRLLIANYGRIISTENKAGVKAVVELLMQSSASSNALASPLQSPGVSREGDAHAVGELQRLLLSGQTEEAHRFAVANHLWSHAMLLASNVSADAFKQTVRQFAEAVLVDGSPMRSMYLLFSGNPKEVFQPSSGADGSGVLRHWQENLAVVLNNGQPSSPASKAIMGTMADRLWQHEGVVEAAHFCYMVAEHEFAYFDNPNARLVLLGADHKRSRRTFVAPDAIQRTETVEYATALSNPQFFIPQIQVYKLIYAYQLAEVGLLDQARKYHQAVNTLFTQNKSSFANANPLFAEKLAQLGERLSSMGQQAQASGGGWSLPRLRIPGILSALVGSGDETGAAAAAAPLSARTASPSPTPTIVSSGAEPVSSAGASPRPAPEPPAPAEPKPSPKKEAPKKSASKSKIAGAMSAAVGFFSRQNQADLGEENAFEYNKELKRWVKKGADLSQLAAEEEVKMAPPPTDLGPSGPPTAGGRSALTDGTPQRRRAKYVDTLNPAGLSASVGPGAPAAAGPAPLSAIPPHMGALGGNSTGFHRASSAPNFSVFTPAVFTPAPAPEGESEGGYGGYGGYEPLQAEPVPEPQTQQHRKTASVDFFSLHQ